jgi:hypothetical protein
MWTHMIVSSHKFSLYLQGRKQATLLVPFIEKGTFKLENGYLSFQIQKICQEDDKML